MSEALAPNGTHSPRLASLLGFLSSDPRNTRILSDAASAAVDAQEFELADELLERLTRENAMTPALLNLKGIAAIGRGRNQDANAIFARLLAEGSSDPALRFNLAWTNALLGDYHGAFELLDDATVAASARGPALKVQVMHHLGLLEEALAQADRMLERHPRDQDMIGALASLAIDAERPDLALRFAALAPESHESQAAIGILKLGSFDNAGAAAAFDRAIEKQPRNARAWMGKGLALQSRGELAAGSEAIDKGAELFDRHVGSWIAAGWARFAVGDFPGARQRFERALALDANFAESHGGLAVIDLIEGDLENAKRRTAVALRLDRNCFGAALAASLMLQQRGDWRAAAAIRTKALNAPVGPDGLTLAQAMIGFGLAPRN